MFIIPCLVKSTRFKTMKWLVSRCGEKWDVSIICSVFYPCLCKMYDPNSIKTTTNKEKIG